MLKFDSFSYYPALRTRPAELLGYSHLAEQIKDSLIPTITLGSWPKQEGVQHSISQALNAVGNRPLILDITKEKTYLNNELQALLTPDDGFKQWREFIAKYQNIVPVVQLHSQAKLPQIIKQARQFEMIGTKRVAFRVTDFQQEIPRVINALATLESAENAIVIIDLGYIRETMAASIAAGVGAINDIRAEVPEAIIAITSTSFPASVTRFMNNDGTQGIINILERELHEAIGTDACIYGDHGSIHSKVYVQTGGKYTPRIDYPLDDAWIFERRPNLDSTGYIEAAQKLLELHPSIGTDNTWGAQKIREVSQNQLDGMKVAASWIAARVNMHITKQTDLSSAIQNSSDDDLELE